MVFSEVEEGSEGNGHKGEVTKKQSVSKGTSTDGDNVRGDTGDTLGKTETGHETKPRMRPCVGPTECLIGCKGQWPRLDLAES